jgi:hypothetical protein
MTQINSKLSVGRASVGYNDIYNDIAMVTSAVPFIIMERFLAQSLQKIDQLLLSNGIDNHEIRIAFYPSKNDDLQEGLRIIRKGKSNTPVLFDVSSARVQFHFYKTYCGDGNQEQKSRNKLYRQLWGQLSCVPEKVFEELLTAEEYHY